MYVYRHRDIYGYKHTYAHARTHPKYTFLAIFLKMSNRKKFQ